MHVQLYEETHGIGVGATFHLCKISVVMSEVRLTWNGDAERAWHACITKACDILSTSCYEILVDAVIVKPPSLD